MENKRTGTVHYHTSFVNEPLQNVGEKAAILWQGSEQVK